MPINIASLNLGDLIRRDCDQDKTAIIDVGEQGSRPFTYREIHMLACGVARALLARGLSRGDRVAILSANRAEYIAVVFGIMRAGLVAVPVNFKFPRETIAFILADCGARLVFCDGARRAACPPEMPVVDFDRFEAFVDRGAFEAVVPTAAEPAMFLYTSGSTGVPKGVALSHQSHLWVVKTRLATMNLAEQRFLIAAPLYHMNALALSQLAIAAHATIVLLPQFTAASYIDAIQTHHCTWLTAVPPMIAMMLRDPKLAGADLSSVAFVRMGSAPVSESLMQDITALLPRASITNAYGTTEGGPVVFGPHPAGLKTPQLSVGYPHPDVELRLGLANVLEMKCAGLMNGYYNRPEMTPPITPDGFYVTGDVFRLDENGFYFFVGRSDDMFVSGGENIYSGDVEKMLERHPGIAQAAVVPIDDAIKGQKPVAFVVLKIGARLSEEAVKEFALAHAPAFQHPRHVWFLDRLPLASTNKIDRASLMNSALRLLFTQA